MMSKKPKKKNYTQTSLDDVWNSIPGNETAIVQRFLCVDVEVEKKI